MSIEAAEVRSRGLKAMIFGLVALISPWLLLPLFALPGISTADAGLISYIVWLFFLGLMSFVGLALVIGGGLALVSSRFQR
jgi:polyferredoxin